VCYVKLLPLREFFLHVHPIADLETTGGIHIHIDLLFIQASVGKQEEG
jgi:hypothetical protein